VAGAVVTAGAMNGNGYRSVGTGVPYSIQSIYYRDIGWLPPRSALVPRQAARVRFGEKCHPDVHTGTFSRSNLVAMSSDSGGDGWQWVPTTARCTVQDTL
jgi:hypothetical protein